MRHKAAGLPHNPLKAIVAPRPIGWISSRGSNNSINLAPYSFFNALSEDPAMVMFSVQTDSVDHHKDSLRNVEETSEFVVNIVGEAQFDSMNISSGNFAYGDNEFIHAGLEMVDSDSISTPRVGNVPAALECVHYETLHLPRNPQGSGYIVVIGTVTRIYIDDAVIRNGMIDYSAFIPISRLGYRDYGRSSDIFQKNRPE
ncbi:MAG: flavin reductase [Rhodospirillaceae bacterium]|nr:flavin reductase [Rhodospirillaceae bacterium]